MVDCSIYKIQYETSSIAKNWAVVSAESEERARSLLENYILERYRQIGYTANIPESIGFKTGEIKISGVKGNMEDVLFCNEQEWSKQ